MTNEERMVFVREKIGSLNGSEYTEEDVTDVVRAIVDVWEENIKDVQLDAPVVSPRR